MRAYISSDIMQSCILMGMRLTTLVVKFAFTLFIAKILGVEELGIYGLLAAIFVTAPSFLSLSLGYGLSRNAPIVSHAETTNEMSFYLSHMLITYAIVLLAILIYGAIQDEFVIPILIWSILLCEQINNDGYTFCQNIARSYLANILHFIRNAAWMIAFMIVAWLIPEMQNLQTLLIFWLCGVVLASVVIACYLGNYIQLKNHYKKGYFSSVKKRFQDNKKAYFNGQLISIYSYAGHFMITFFLGLEQTGVYVFFMQIYSAMRNLILTGIHQPIRGKLIKAYHDDNVILFASHIKRNIKKAVSFSVLFALLSIPSVYIIAKFLVKDPIITQQLWLYPFLMIGFIASNITDTHRIAFYSRKQDNIILNLNILMTIVTLVLTAIFGWILQLQGAIYAFSLSAVFLLYAFHRTAKMHYLEK